METTAPPTAASTTGPDIWKLRVVGAFAVIAAVLYLQPGPFFRPELWAEDGAELLAGPLFEGFWSCFRPIAFTFLMLPRFVAFLAVTFLPLWMVPIVFAWVPLLTAGVVLSSIVRDDMSWIHPDRRWRFAIVVGFAVVPALAEVTMALCNGSYVLGLAAFLFCLRDHTRFSGRSAALMVCLMLSSAITILVPFIWGWRALCEKRERATHLKFLAASIAPFILMVVSALANPFAGDTGLVYTHTPPAYGIAPFDLWMLIEIFVSRLGILMVGLPWLGLMQTTALMQQNALFWITPLIAVVVLVGFWRVHPRIVVGVLLGVVLFPLMHLGRNYGPVLEVTSGMAFPFLRGSLVAQIFVVIGYAALAMRAPIFLRWLVVVPLVQFGLTALGGSNIAAVWEFEPKRSFTQVAEVIEAQREAIAAGETNVLLTPIIPVHPHNWATFQIRLLPSTHPLRAPQPSQSP